MLSLVQDEMRVASIALVVRSKADSARKTDAKESWVILRIGFIK